MITILYIDADPKIRRILSDILEKYEISVVPKQSGEAALEWLSRNRADVIVSEYYLPEMSGLAFHRAVRAGGISSPFIFFSESDNSWMKNETCEKEVFGFIARSGTERKPILNLVRMILWATASHETKVLFSDEGPDHRQLE